MGFYTFIERTGGANCCPWCAGLVGRWTIKNAPKDVFGVHDNCTCMVEYTNSRGVTSQSVGGAKFVDMPYEPPHRMTAEEAAAKGGFSQPRRLTGGANGGIIKQESSLNFTPLSQESVVPILRRESEKWIEQLTEEEKRAIKKYTKNSDDPKDDKFYARLNDMLRGERPSDSTLEYYSKLISDGLSKFKLNNNITCYRALSFDAYKDFKVGNILVEPQFVSTSVTKSKELNMPFKITIRVPQGGRGAYIENLSKYPNQREFLIDKNIPFRVISKSNNHIELEMIV